ncbi:TonB-dependent receptor [Sphingomonas abietis]|uniref:TonB-dependent receptor n=1 Tax=Sphingomonas abietis TaxID=3012344 RepID=A0ABY7NR68_9SPHN|nr:TonB-dependent receptor [Sphingomonas abietis]WBO24008.1 TonB-dependent receptor [Sphingomonas abietis]
MIDMKTSLRLTSGVAAILIAASSPAVMAQDSAAPAGVQASQDATQPAPISARAKKRLERAAARRRAKEDKIAHKKGETAGAEGNDIVVVGLKGSLESSRNKKRKAKQIVDSVTAEDAGKLPDNNVPEALARVTGVAIDRVHGEGQNVTIRGLSDIQTTINNNDVGGVSRSGTGVEASIGPSRSMTLADIPAELLKSVDVYKTRTADQVEGGIAGTVNVELRRPLDLKKGWTVAGSFRDVHSDIGNTFSPYGSMLVAYHADTGIGEMGFLVNASYEKNKYEEDYVFDESPQLAPSGTPSYLSLPANLRDSLAIPYRVTYGVDSGEVTRPSLNASYQWKPSDKLEFVLEGSWLGSREDANSNTLRLITNDGNSTYSNLVLNPEGTIKSLTMTNPNGFAGGPESSYNHIVSNAFNTNFEAHWHSDRVKIDAGVQYTWTKAHNRFLNVMGAFAGNTSANVDFDSSLVPGGGPFVQFNGVDYSDPSDYVIRQIHDEYTKSSSNSLNAHLDFTVDTSDTGFFRSLQFGARATDSKTSSYTGYRDGGFDVLASRPGISSVPGTALETTTPDIPGVSTPTWYHLDSEQLLSNWAQTRAYLSALNPTMYDGGTYATDLPDADSYNDSKEHEYTWAAYAQFNYGFKAIFPIDGVIGARVTNTWGSSMGAVAVGGTNAKTGVYSTTYTPSSARANYVDFLPNLNAIVHFTKNVQLRLAYTWNVQRPDFGSLSPQVQYNADTIRTEYSYVYSGNPDLKPIKERSYDASLEYYFGRAGQLSAGAFLKTQKGFIYYTEEIGKVPGLPDGDVDHYIGKPRNAGPGKIQGFEFAGQSFFDFLPGIWHNFGVNANLTYIPTASLDLGEYGLIGTTQDVPGLRYAPYTSKITYNAALFYDTPVFGARVAWNYRSKYKNDINSYSPVYQIYTKATSRLDASINYTPFKFLTFTLEGTNLLRSYQNQYYGAVAGLPVGVRVQARTVQAGARFRF